MVSWTRVFFFYCMISENAFILEFSLLDVRFKSFLIQIYFSCYYQKQKWIIMNIIYVEYFLQCTIFYENLSKYKYNVEEQYWSNHSARFVTCIVSMPQTGIPYMHFMPMVEIKLCQTSIDQIDNDFNKRHLIFYASRLYS